MSVRSDLAGGVIALLVAGLPVSSVLAQGTSADRDAAFRCHVDAIDQIGRDGADYLVLFSAELLAYETNCLRPMGRLGERVYWLASRAAQLCADRYDEWRCVPSELERLFGGQFRSRDRELSEASAADRAQKCTRLDDPMLAEPIAQLDARTKAFATMIRAIDLDPDQLLQRCKHGWLNSEHPDRK